MQKALSDNTYKLEGKFWRKLVKGAGHKDNHDKHSWGKLPAEEYFDVCLGFYLSISRT